MGTLALELTDLQQRGPVFDLKLVVTQEDAAKRTAEGRLVPDPVGVSAVIDTAARRTVVHRELLDPLGLEPVGEALVAASCATETLAAPVYRVRLVHEVFPAFDGEVVALPLQQGVEMLIGRDLLALATLVYVGPSNTVVLSF